MFKSLKVGLTVASLAATMLVVTDAPAQATVECATTTVQTLASSGNFTFHATGATVDISLNAKVDATTHAYCGTMWAYLAYHPGGTGMYALATAHLYYGSTSNLSAQASNTESASGLNGLYFDSPLEGAACGAADVELVFDGTLYAYGTGTNGAPGTIICP